MEEDGALPIIAVPPPHVQQIYPNISLKMYNKYMKRKVQLLTSNNME
jgi:hypothetical protein